MKIRKRLLPFCYLLLGLGLVWAWPFDTPLCEYLSGSFWFPFAKHPAAFERPHVRRVNAPFAGMTAGQDDSPLGRLRRAYQPISLQASDTEASVGDLGKLRQAVASARSDASLTPKQKEEVALIDAKIDLRAAGADDEQLLLSAKQKLAAFLRTARTPEFRSEARGWLGRVNYLLGDQTAAGKIYLDELNRSGSNLGRETLLNSLSMNYGYDGGQELLDHLEEYFDTPEHAAFAIDLVTNPRWPGHGERFQRDRLPRSYERVKALLEKHADLLKSNAGAGTLALLGMRIALRMGDPPAAREIGCNAPQLLPPAFSR